MSNLKCRACKTELVHTFANLGMTPLANAYVPLEKQWSMEPFYPLHAFVCDQCFLVQLSEFESPEVIFKDYAYFSSFSDTWLTHCRDYATEMIHRFHLNTSHQVVELASNDGYLLQYFQEKGIPVLGVEPAENVAEVAKKSGIPTIVRFFGQDTAQALLENGIQTDLLIANNVLAHVPNLMDFISGIQTILKPEGLFTIEFPHLLQMILHNQFDTIYHEHFSYFSFQTVERLFKHFNLVLFDVEELTTHGGSLRIYGKHAGGKQAMTPNVERLRKKELQAGLDQLSTYQSFQENLQKKKHAFVQFLLAAKKDGKKVAGYGAPAKGNTLLNYCGVGTDLIEFTVDRSPYKQGNLLPGTRIPIGHPDKIQEERPDYVVILPWNLQDEIMNKLSYIREWGGEFVLPLSPKKLAVI